MDKHPALKDVHIESYHYWDLDNRHHSDHLPASGNYVIVGATKNEGAGTGWTLYDAEPLVAWALVESHSHHVPDLFTSVVGLVAGDTVEFCDEISNFHMYDKE